MKMPFGRYRGWAIADLPDEYLEWLGSLDDLRRLLRNAVQDELKRRDAQNAVQHDVGDLCPDVEVANELVTAGFHTLARRRHPDAGGNHDDMRKVNAVSEWLRSQIRRLSA